MLAMTTKFNDATSNRPLGERPIDAPLLGVDITSYLSQLSLETAWLNGDRNAITVFKSEQLTIIIGGLRTDAVMQPGTISTNGIISLHIITGQLNIATEIQNIALSDNQIVTINEDVPYAIKAQEDTFYIMHIVTQQ